MFQLQWNADISAGNAKDLLSPSTQHQRLAVQLRLVEEAKEKRIRRDLNTLRQSKSITLTGGEASLVLRYFNYYTTINYLGII
jgi:hypothetical protein